MPGIVFKVPDARSCVRANFRGESIGIRLIHLVIAIARFDVIFVGGSLSDIGNEAFPNASGGGAHNRRVWVPLVEVADYCDTLGIRRPNGELHPALALFLGDMGAELFVGAVMGAFREQVEVEFAYCWLQTSRSFFY